MILITGATGHLGGAAVAQLLKNAYKGQFVVLARNEAKAQFFLEKNITVRYGDFDDKASLDEALQGIEKVLLIPSIAPNRLQQNQRVVDAALQNGVQHIVYTGVSFRDIASSETPGLDAHFKTEAYIRESGLTYTFLRNTLYTDGLPMFTGDKVFDKGIYLPAGNGNVPYALRREMGEAAANVLLQTGHENKTYEITGRELYSYADVADALSEFSGAMVRYTAAEPQAFVQQMKEAGLDEFLVFVLAGFNADIRKGQYEIVTGDLEMLLGRKPAGLRDGLEEVYHL